MTRSRTATPSRALLSKVPEVTVHFWVVKLLCTTVGETAADFLDVNLGLGLAWTSVVTGLLLAVALAVQFRADRYLPGPYWLTVALVSVFGTLVTDNLTDGVGVPLEVSTVSFAVLLGVVFAAWYAGERTLSIHSVVTRRREAFYWLAVLLTFALGTAYGDLMAEVLGLGYLATGVTVAVVIALTAAGRRLGLHPVLAFWIIYVLTRPLGASLGDYASQPASQGGLGLGATTTSLVFAAAILATVGYLAVTKADVVGRAATAGDARAATGRGGLLQVVVTVTVVVAVAVAGYVVRTSSLAAPAAVAAGVPGSPAAASATSPLGDLAPFRVISQDTLNLLAAGDQAGATARVDDLELEWDEAEAHLRPRNRAPWTDVDDRVDAVLRELRSTRPDVNAERAALAQLLAVLG